jgi:hypothetical protein
MEDKRLNQKVGTDTRMFKCPGKKAAKYLITSPTTYDSST